MKKEVLITAAEEDAVSILEYLKEKDLRAVHYPLERYKANADSASVKEFLDGLAEFENIVYGSLINARYFVEQAEKHKAKKAVRQCLNLTLDEDSAKFLEEHGVPAVCTFAGGRAINAVEFMLRLRRMGATLYPCGSHRKEELPGLLQELDIPVQELELYDLEGPKEEDLNRFRKEMEDRGLYGVVFHSRRSVNRTLAAFPDRNYDGIHVVSADSGVTEHLKDKGIAVAEEGEGSWASIAELL